MDAIDQLADTFGEVTVTIDWHPPRKALPQALSSERRNARQVVSACKRCELRANCSAPVPFSAPIGPVKFAVMGEAPGATEDKKGKPFVGKAGRLLRELMVRVGINPTTDAAWFNAASCFPNEKGKVLTPKARHLQACHTNVLTQRIALHTPFILLVGAQAMSVFRPDLRIARHHGNIYVWDDTYIVMPIYHPAAALRGTPHIKRMIRTDLALWRDIYSGELPPLEHLPLTCAKCHEYIYDMDRDGVGYCKAHWTTFADNWQTARRRWGGKATVDQLALLGEGEGKGEVGPHGEEPF